MPTYRDIALSLQSQYDALTITEAPLKSAQSTSITGAAIVRRRKSEYFLIDDAQTYGGKTAFGTAPASKTANVMIPVYPSSQFWIVYACPAPQDGSSVRFYYFKLVISGKCIVSWGVGALDGWEGKTIFGLFNARSDFQGRKVVEKRGLFFPRVDKLDEEESDVGFEVRVYRSQARKREKAVVELEEAVTGSQGAISMLPLGVLKKGEPRRRYTYALIDPVDEPYATFRYQFDLGSPKGSASSSFTTSTIAHQSSQMQGKISEAPNPGKSLSVPPRLKLTPTRGLFEPTSLVEESGRHSEQHGMRSGSMKPLSSQRSNQETAASGRGRANGVAGFIKEDDRIFVRAATPPSDRKKNSSVGLLRGAIASALRRREGNESTD